MGNFWKMTGKALAVVTLSALFAAAMMFAIYQIDVPVIKILIAISFIVFQYVMLWDNFVVFGVRDARSSDLLARQMAETGRKADKEDSFYIDWKGYAAGAIAVIPWALIYVGSVVSRLINLDPRIGSNTVFKFLHMMTNMPYYTLFIETGLPEAIPFGFIVPLVILPAIAGVAYQYGYMNREAILSKNNVKKYKKPDVFN